MYILILYTFYFICSKYISTFKLILKYHTAITQSAIITSVIFQFNRNYKEYIRNDRCYMNQEWFSSRLTKLRTERKLSARDLSLSLGQSPGYINKIENNRSLPSMQVFFYICEYLKITPAEFFDQEITYPLLLNETISELKKMDSNQLEHILNVLKDINAAKSNNQNYKKR